MNQEGFIKLFPPIIIYILIFLLFLFNFIEYKNSLEVPVITYSSEQLRLVIKIDVKTIYFIIYLN